MPRTQAFPLIASATERPRCLRPTLRSRLGATSCMKHPSSIQRSSQKTEDLPLPSTTSIAAWKADSTTLFPTDGNVTHGRLDWSLRCHSHLSWRATLKRHRSSRPSPPSSLGDIRPAMPPCTAHRRHDRCQTKERHDVACRFVPQPKAISRRRWICVLEWLKE